MLLIRLLAIFLVLITNTWLLSPVRSDALSRHKRAMARRADRELSRLAGEPCTVPGVWRSHRQPRSLSPSQHRPPAARPVTRTSLREPHAAERAPAVCAGACGGDTGAHRAEETGGWGPTEDAYVGLSGRLYEKRSTNERRDRDYVRQDAGQSASSPGRAQSPRGGGGSRSRLARSAGGTLPREDDGNWEKVFRDESTDSKGLQVLHGPRSTPGTVEDSTADYSGEVEEADPAASVPVGSASPWGSPVLRVPPTWMTALYFSGRREQLKLRPDARVELPRDKFSLELWVKPEGGQSNPAVIAGGC